VVRSGLLPSLGSLMRVAPLHAGDPHFGKLNVGSRAEGVIVDSGRHIFSALPHSFADSPHLELTHLS
jgi:hypothetical protein